MSRSFVIPAAQRVARKAFLGPIMTMAVGCGMEGSVQGTHLDRDAPPGAVSFAMASPDEPVDLITNAIRPTRFYGPDFVSAGVGGLRTAGSGYITLNGISGAVKKALLYW